MYISLRLANYLYFKAWNALIMNRIELPKKLVNEESCKAHFNKLREERGICCRKCQGTYLHW